MFFSEARTLMLGRYIAATGATVRMAAQAFGISKSTVHTDVTQRLRGLDRDLFEQVRCVLEKNKAERHLRGGKATQEKYRSLHRDVLEEEQTTPHG